MGALHPARSVFIGHGPISCNPCGPGRDLLEPQFLPNESDFTHFQKMKLWLIRITNYRDCFSRRDHQQEEKSWVTGPRTSTSKFNLINTQYALCIAKFDFVHILGHTSQLLVSLTVDPVQCVLDLEFRVGHGDFMRANFWQIGVSTDRPFSNARLVRVVAYVGGQSALWITWVPTMRGWPFNCPWSSIDSRQ